MGSESYDRVRVITADELSKHNHPSDLGISIQGKVYDVTQWIKDHPGGEIPLLNLSSQDATDAFVVYHPGSVWAHLDRFFIGVFANYKVSPVSRDYRRLNAEFSKLGLFEKKGHGVFFSPIFVFSLFAVSVLGMLKSGSALVHFLSAALLGFVRIQTGWVEHDSGHYIVMQSNQLNRFAQILTGISIGWWIRNHTAHQITCNSLDHDPDLQHLPLFCVSSKFFSSFKLGYYDRKMTFDSAARFFVSITCLIGALFKHFTKSEAPSSILPKSLKTFR